MGELLGYWAMAEKLERLLDNAWGAIETQDPDANPLEYRAAMLTAAARVLARRAPPTTDLERQADLFRKIFLQGLQQERGRQRRMAAAEHAINTYQGPESA